ncbi:MAG TPA: 2-phospho-L-lactate guanylyltransferase [Candidatus Solibacter sp.]|nr:2-phospho-L-lactate guanylyltransferase [Candidatus Solibacter sp.]
MICVVVPIKDFASAKTRLSDRLDPDQRACLAQASAERVLLAVADCDAIDLRVAVVDNDIAAKMALHRGFEVLRRPDLYGQSAAVGAGFHHAANRGATNLLTVSADVPLVRPRDIEQMLKPKPPVLVMVSDRAGLGTNALRLDPFVDMRLHFGPDSLSLHRREAAELKLPVKVIDNPRVRIDIDTPDDIDALEISGPDGRRVLIEAGQLLADQMKDNIWWPRSQRSY